MNELFVRNRVNITYYLYQWMEYSKSNSTPEGNNFQNIFSIFPNNKTISSAENEFQWNCCHSFGHFECHFDRSLRKNYRKTSKSLKILSNNSNSLIIELKTQETEGQLDIQGEYLPSLDKRPFCNAFTGCGKRSGYENRGQNNPFMKINRKMINEAKMLQLLQNRYNNNEVINYLTIISYRFSKSDKFCEPLSNRSLLCPSLE